MKGKKDKKCKKSIKSINEFIIKGNCKNKKKKRKYIVITKIFIISIIVLISLLLLNSNIYAETNPKLVNKIKKAFDKIQKYILVVATPIAAVSISTGLLMRKFSFGDEEKVRTSKKLIRGTIYSYVFILSTKFVLEFIQSLLK